MADAQHPAGEREGDILCKYWIQSWNDLVNLTIEQDPNKAKVTFPGTGFYSFDDPEGASNQLQDIAQDIGFPETKRVINFYLRSAPNPEFSDFLLRWPEYQRVAHSVKHDRMYREPDPRPED